MLQTSFIIKLYYDENNLQHVFLAVLNYLFF